MITLQFSTTSAFISRAIRFITWSEFSHVDVVLPDGGLLGAHLDGVKIRRPETQKFTKTARFTVSMTPEQEARFYEFLYKQVGKPYDKTAIFGILVHRDWQEDDSWFCSELVAAACEYAGVSLIREKRNRITPRDEVMSPLLHPVDAMARTLKARA